MRILCLLSTTLALQLGLTACGSLPRDESNLRLAPQQVSATMEPRIRASDEVALRALTQEFTEGLTSRNLREVLAISGGGANGAYGAGIVAGWTQRGDRPQFEMVTGVSTGALTAPFAFLGPEWDDELVAAYTDGQASHLLRRRPWTLLEGPSLFSARGLRDLVDRFVTPEMIAAIADEYAQGRRLLVVTTNLDSGDSVIWDMGGLAAQGPDAIDLFKDVLVASSSIPGVFAPVLIPAIGPTGEVILEMHADGGVNTPFLAVPEGALLWTAPEQLTSNASIYVIVNGQLGRRPGASNGHLLDILARSYDSLSRATARQALIATGAFAARNHFDLRYTSIPDNASISSLNFAQPSMAALFEFGRASIQSDTFWNRMEFEGEVSLPDSFIVPDGDLPQMLQAGH